MADRKRSVLSALGGLCLGLGLLAARPAAAEIVYPPLTLLEPAQIHQYGPLLRGNDLVLIESEPDGGLKQITAMTLVAAAPAAVRDAVIHAERYPEFVRNMPLSSVTQRPDGTFDHHYRLTYSVVSSDGANRYQMLPPMTGPGEEGDAAPVRIMDVTGSSHYRWEFHRPESGGGTIVVVYGRTDLRHSGGIWKACLQHAQTLEHGLATVIQMTLMLAMKARAEQAPGSFAPYVSPRPGTRLPSYQPLLDRGLVALLRSQQGRLLDLSLVERSKAAPERVLSAAAQVADWSSFVPTISKSVPTGGPPPVVDIEQTLPMLSFRTSYGVQQGPGAVDLFGLAGDLRGARLRFDARPDGAQKATQVVLRGQMHYDKGSMVLRQLYKMEPLFEYGVNLGLGLTLLRGVRQQAERL